MKRSRIDQQRKCAGKRKRDGTRCVARMAEAQGNTCAYCGNDFGAVVHRRGHGLIRLHPVKDHIIPWAYSQDSSARNLVAACQICNGLKGSKVFKTWEDVRETLRAAWLAKGIVLNDIKEIER